MNTYILNEDGEPVLESDTIAWGRFMSDREARVVAKSEVGWPLGKKTEVSTIFLGLDHSYSGGPPILWETMVFGGKHDGWQDRYTSLDDAAEGHLRVVEALQKGEAP